jgi:DNA invertase Pin-like site-specific DNA recombinase
VSDPYRTPRRVGLYGRVSIDSRDGRSVDSQLAVGRQWAAREAHQIVGEYRDDGISAFDPSKLRPDWQRVMDDIVARKMDILWVWEASRASRDRAVWAALIAACAEAHVLISVNGKSHDVTDPDDGFVLDLGAAMAVRESAYIRKRVQRATLAAAEEGRPFGSIPYGYRREYDARSGSPVQQVPDEETAPVVREIVARVLAGEALYRIAVDLNRRGVPTPQMIRDRRLGRDGVRRGGWNNPKLRKLLASPTMAGLRVHQGAVIGKASWEPLVPPADHVRALQIINDPNRRTQRGTAPKYLLSGIAECGVCGGWMRRFLNRGKASYGCAGVNNTNDGHVSRLAAPLDAFVVRVVVSRLSRPDAFELFAAREDDTEALEAAEERSALQATLKVLEDGFNENPIPAAAVVFQRQVNVLTARLAELEPLIMQRDVPRVVLELTGADAGEVWGGLSLTDQRQVIRYLMRIRVDRSTRPRGAQGFDPSAVRIEWL